MNNFTALVESYLKGDKKDPEDLPTFIEKRTAGADKIYKMAEKKGQYSTLTAIHFKAKAVPYKICSKHINDEDSKAVKVKADECFERLKKWHEMSQRDFQHVMGQLEAYGEVYIRSVECKGK
jgi:hypothetical protein